MTRKITWPLIFTLFVAALFRHDTIIDVKNGSDRYIIELKPSPANLFELDTHHIEQLNTAEGFQIKNESACVVVWSNSKR